MTIRTVHYSGVSSTLTVDELDLELPYPASWCDEHLVTVNDDGTIRVSYLADDSERPDLDDDCFWGWEYLILHNQNDADRLYAKLHDCADCGYDEHTYEHDDCDGFQPRPWRVALDAGRAFFIEKYEHGLVRYALPGESSAVDRQWDVTGVAGIMVVDVDVDWSPDVDLRECARNTLQQYTDWCNGNIFGVVHVTFDADGMQVGDDDACWGYIGDEYAIETMKAEH